MSRTTSGGSFHNFHLSLSQIHRHKQSNNHSTTTFHLTCAFSSKRCTRANTWNIKKNRRKETPHSLTIFCCSLFIYLVVLLVFLSVNLQRREITHGKNEPKVCIWSVQFDAKRWNKYIGEKGKTNSAATIRCVAIKK